MPRVYEIIPTVATTRHADGRVVHDDQVMYMLSKEAEDALDGILDPYDRSAALYLDSLRVKSPGPWAFVMLRKEYDIANYILDRRSKLGGRSAFAFTFYDNRVDADADGFVPKVGSLLFFSRSALEGAADEIHFLRPAWDVLNERLPSKHWLVLLDEASEDVFNEANQS
jgi:hypothetical protein